MTLPVIHVPSALFSATATLLASFRAPRHVSTELDGDGDSGGDEGEGVVYWLGLEVDQIAIVTTLAVPDADTSWGGVRTTAAANAEVTAFMAGTPLVFIGQAHSHPGKSVDHSPIDDRDTFAQFPGALSVVFPYYGKRGAAIHQCGIHRLLGGSFVRLRGNAISAHVRVVPGLVDFRRESR